MVERKPKITKTTKYISENEIFLLIKPIHSKKLLLNENYTYKNLEAIPR